MKNNHYLFNSSFKSLSRTPNKIMRGFILMALIVFCIFQLGKDCANYDKRHSGYVNKTR